MKARVTAFGRRVQSGASLVLFTIALLALFAFAALAIDGANLYVARVELQNAADSGALAGARVLYNDVGTSINTDLTTGYEPTAIAAATANFSQGSPAEVEIVERGHWSFQSRTFTTIAREAVCDLTRSAATIDADTSEATACVNAVRVTTQRSDTRVPAFFGTVLGFNDYLVKARAVAYVGYAGTLRPEDVDQPVAICRDALGDVATDLCSIGRFIPSSDETFSETGGYSSFDQEDACLGGTNTPEIRGLICANGNPTSLTLGEPLETFGGMTDASFRDIEDCWNARTQVNDEGQQMTLWNMTLPVVECNDSNVGPCNDLVGAVNVNVVWIVRDANKIDDDAPRDMQLPDLNEDGELNDGYWSNDSSDGIERWNDFVKEFRIVAPDGELAYHDDNPQLSGWRAKTIYFLPDCTPHVPSGRTGGENFGVMARIPVLVD
jgi:Flp pilus assembly protein TadG